MSDVDAQSARGAQTAQTGRHIAAWSPAWLLRLTGFVEAVTWSLLLIGMFLKYVTRTTDVVVSVAGMLHGIAFVAFGVTTVAVAVDARWSARRTVGVLASSIPPLLTVPVVLRRERDEALQAWRLQSDEPSSFRERAVALAVRHPGRGVAVGLAIIAALTLLALLVGPPVGG